MEKQIKSSDWLIKGYSKEQLEEMKANAIKEAEQELEKKQIKKNAVDLTKIQAPTILDKETWQIKNEIYAEITKAENQFLEFEMPILEIEGYVAEHLAKQGYRKEIDIVAEVLNEIKNFITSKIAEREYYTEIEIKTQAKTYNRIWGLLDKIEKKYKGE